jgi:hypothetical protein
MMKRLIIPALVAFALSFTACKEDFDIAAPHKDVTVVYAMLNMGDTAHYVRIQKAFMDQNKSAIDLAKISDSSFYADGVLDVVVKEIAKPGGSLLSTTTLQRVNMDAEGYPKQTGMFFTTPQYAYKFKKALSPANEYRLVIRNTVTGKVDSAQTGVITNDSTTVDGFYIFDFGFGAVPPASISFARTTAASDKYTLGVRIPPPAKVLEGVIRFSYWERDNINADVQKFLDFPFGPALVENNSGRLEVLNSAFYDFFREKLGEAPANVQRFLDSTCTIDVYAGTEDYYQYQQISETQKYGITANEIKPLYTNLKGADIYGLFSSRARRRGINIPIAPITFDSLASNPRTQPTGLQDRAYGQ